MLSNYFCIILGENQQQTSRWHTSTLRRAKAFALAIHIPVILWALSGYVSAATVFQLSTNAAICVGLACAFLIFLVERIVLATPKGMWVTLFRIAMGIVIATLGSMTVDLALFKREIDVQLKTQAEEELRVAQRRDREQLWQELSQKKADWQRIQNAANCEANGTCGSGIRNVGPVYQELAQQANFLKAEYMATQNRWQQLETEQTQEFKAFKSSTSAIDNAGLLARTKALHQVIMMDTAALMTWCLFFGLLLMFELLVVICKLLFKETVDDELDRQRELISRSKANAYVDAITSPVMHAQQWLANEMR